MSSESQKDMFAEQEDNCNNNNLQCIEEDGSDASSPFHCGQRVRVPPNANLDSNVQATEDSPLPPGQRVRTPNANLDRNVQATEESMNEDSPLQPGQRVRVPPNANLDRNVQRNEECGSGSSSPLICGQKRLQNANRVQKVEEKTGDCLTEAIQDSSMPSTYELYSSSCTPPISDEENCELKKYSLKLLMNSIAYADYSLQIDDCSRIILHPIQSHTISNSIREICGGGVLKRSVGGVAPSSSLTEDLLTAAKEYIQNYYSDFLEKKEHESCRRRTLCDEASRNTVRKKEEPGSSTDRKTPLYKIKIQFNVVCELTCKAEVNENTNHVATLDIYKYKNRRITATELKPIRYLNIKKLQRKKGNVVYASEDSVAKTLFRGIRSKLSSEFMIGKLFKEMEIEALCSSDE